MTHSQQLYCCSSLSINEGKISAGQEVVTLETIQLPSIPQEVSLVRPHTFFIGVTPILTEHKQVTLSHSLHMLFTVPHFAVCSARNY